MRACAIDDSFTFKLPLPGVATSYCLPFSYFFTATRRLRGQPGFQNTGSDRDG
jgi:hypothetical protein